MTILAGLLFAVLAPIAALHAYWGFGGHWPAQDAASLARMVVGVAVFPSSRACFVVAVILCGVAVWPLLVAHVVPIAGPGGLSLVGSVVLACIFLLRGVAGYLPVWRSSHPLEPFARYDRYVYAPLCLALGGGFLALAIAAAGGELDRCAESSAFWGRGRSQAKSLRRCGGSNIAAMIQPA
jgi:hypothetical protein